MKLGFLWLMGNLAVWLLENTFTTYHDRRLIFFNS